MKRFITILLLIPFIGYSQTCIVAIKHNDTIMVGADSRASQSGVNLLTGEKISRSADTSCKIISNSTGDINFSLSGYDGIGLRNLAKQIIDTAKSISSFELSYEQMAMSHILKRINNVSDLEKQYLFSTFTIGYIVSDAVVFGRINGALFLHYLAIVRAPSDSLKMTFQMGRNDTLSHAVIGEWEEIYRDKLFSNRDVWKNGLSNGIEYLINYSSKYHPEFVGGPINILMVTKRKTIWIGKKPPCY